MTGSFVTGEDTVLKNLGILESKMMTGVVKAGDEISHILANYAKTHHPWTPRTGNTDQSTIGYIAEITNEFVMVALSAGMSYDVFLELAHSGKWAWLWPAVVACKDDINACLKRNIEQAMML
jgi:hypothetical protein